MVNIFLHTVPVVYERSITLPITVLVLVRVPYLLAQRRGQPMVSTCALRPGGEADVDPAPAPGRGHRPRRTESLRRSRRGSQQDGILSTSHALLGLVA